jgi:hypothetical protein
VVNVLNFGFLAYTNCLGWTGEEQGAMEGAHVGEELVLLLLIMAAVTEVVARRKQGWRRRRRRGCSYEQSLVLKAEDMYLVRFTTKINQYKHLYSTTFYIDIASSKELDTLMPVQTECMISISVGPT